MKSSYIWAMGLALMVGLILGCEDKNRQVQMAPEPPPAPPPERTYPPVPPPPPVTATTPPPSTPSDTYTPPPVDESHKLPPEKTTTRRPRPAPVEHYAAERPSKGGQTYTVKKGDTLQEISKKFYGTTKKFNKIYQANKGKIKDPNKLIVGMKLTIPAK